MSQLCHLWQYNFFLKVSLFSVHIFWSSGLLETWQTAKKGQPLLLFFSLSLSHNWVRQLFSCLTPIHFKRDPQGIFWLHSEGRNTLLVFTSFSFRFFYSMCLVLISWKKKEFFKKSFEPKFCQKAFWFFLFLI